MIGLVALVVLLGVGGVGLAALCRPRSVSGWVALTLCGAWAIAVLLVDGVGRVRYDAATMLVGALVFAAAGVLAWRRSGATRPRRIRRRVSLATRPWWMRGLLVLWVVLMVYSAASVWVMPPSVPDVLRYHLPMSVAWMREGHVGVVPELDYRANFFPHGVQLLSGLTILMRGDDKMSAFPQVVLSGVLFPVVCYALSRVLGLARRFAAGAAMLGSLCAPVVLQMRHEVADVGHYAAILLGVAVAFDGVRSSARVCERRWVAMGIAAGLALGTKSTGPLVVAALAGGWVLAHMIRERRVLSMIDRGFLARSFGVLGITLLIGFWVFGYNLIVYANPVYPMVISIGPLSFPGPGEFSPLRANAWIFDFSKSPTQRLLGGVARWPDVMLSLPQRDYERAPDFRDNRSPTNSGFGLVTAACTVLAFVFAIASCVVMVKRRRVPRRVWVWAGVLVTLAVYNAAFLSQVSLITAPDSTVDARYQLHLAFVVALLSVGGVGYVWRKRLSALVMVPMLALSVHSSALLVGVDLFELGEERTDTPQPHRGWKAFSRMIDRDLPRLWGWTGRPYFLATDPEEVYELLEGERTVLQIGRGRCYALMLPGFDRRVISIGAQGPDYRVDSTMGVDPALTREIMGFYFERWRITSDPETLNAPDYAQQLADHRERYPTPDIYRNARRYFLETAVKHDARYIVSTTGRFLAVLDGDGVVFGPDPHWERVYETVHPSGRITNVVYRLREDLIGSDEFGTVLEDPAP